ncbi:MAG: Fe(2+) transporter permease subunit FeoB [Burkholderiales bacterium]|jgi:ferrous iron transport protein B|nr:Fe(2+) transporter permease subunit FeoB [Burkholderiales bacterium]
MIPHDHIALIGNPNCGKTTLFNALTGSRQRVGNWPGVTVERKTGVYRHGGKRVHVVDLPGTYAIESSAAGVSQDEQIARNFVLNEREALIVNIVDATNLQRNLYLTFQLLDLRRPMVVVLNMIDAVRDNGEVIDIARLQEQLGCPVVGVSASRGEGIEALRDTIETMLQQRTVPQPKVTTLGEKQEAVLAKTLEASPKESPLRTMTRWQMLEALQWGYQTEHETENETRHEPLDDFSEQALTRCRQDLAGWCNGEIDIALASARYDTIDALSREVIERPRQASKSMTAMIDRWALGRITGIPLFFLAMYVMFLLAIRFGSAFIDFFDILFGTVLVEGSQYLLKGIGAPDWLNAVLSNGLGGGIQTVATFVPIIAAMFLCLSFLEDSGYLARAAMVVDRGMRAIGLPGKAFVPMLIGFGCNVPAIMGTRTLESTRDRLMSIMMIPYMSCGARLPVYALLVAVFFPANGQNIVFALYLGGIAVAVLTGFVLKHTLLPGAITPFIMELPPYRLPTARNMLTLTWERLKSFVIHAGKAIVLMMMVLSFFNSLGTDGSFGNENTDKSVLSNIGQTITPAFAPMGIEEKNWPATVGIFTGIFAKETIIGTLNALYSQRGEEAADAAGNVAVGYQPLEGIKKALATIPENLKGAVVGVVDPLGVASTLGDVEAVSEKQGVEQTAVSRMRVAFGTTAAVMAYLIFILLYTPCVAALGAIYREAGVKWMTLAAVWTFVLAWICATGYYQLSLLGSSPASAGLWLFGLAAMLVGLFFVLRYFGSAPFSKGVAPKAAGVCLDHTLSSRDRASQNSGKKGCC